MKNFLAFIVGLFFGCSLLFSLKANAQQMGSGHSPVLRTNDSLPSFLNKSLAVSETTIDFLFHYYDQDGNHSAVTGGTGTEELSDLDGKIIVNIALDSISSLQINGGMNYYSSASTDRIDPLLSSASRSDLQVQLYFGWEENPRAKNIHYGLSCGGATESDYLSTSFGGFYGWLSNDRNREFQLGTQLFFDRWQLFFPDELRGTPEAVVSTDRRNAYNFSLNYFQVINQRLQFSLSSDLSWQQGLLSTPFHRVYLQGADVARLERLPGSRLRIPLGIRLHYYWGDHLVGRIFYRYYWDTFGVNAHSAQAELAIRLGDYFTLTPSLRLHHQEAARYFAPFQMHLAGEKYYTSDYDLSRFNSRQYGLSMKYAPLYGLSRWYFGNKKGLGMLKNIELRFTRYERSDGLKAFVISTACQFSFVKQMNGLDLK